MEKATKKRGAGRVILRMLGILLALILCAAALFFFVPLTEKADTSPVTGSADWMSRLDDGLLLSGITLPGTHDSATQYVQLAWFSKCQSLDVGGQLECRRGVGRDMGFKGHAGGEASALVVHGIAYRLP